MTEQKCIHRVWDRYGDHLCGRKAGYGPEGSYCKQHARSEFGEKFGEEITLYRVVSADYRGPIRLMEVEAEDTGKLYRLPPDAQGFGYAQNIPKDVTARKGIFTNKEEAVMDFLRTARARVANARKSLEQAIMAEKEAMAFAQDCGITLDAE